MSERLVYAGPDLEGLRGGTVGVNATSGSPGGVSEGLYRITARTVLARWVGKFRPYFAVDYSFGIPATQAYDSQNLYDTNYGRATDQEQADFDLSPDHLASDCTVTTEQWFARCRNKRQDFAGDPARTIDFGAGIKPRHIGGTEFGVSTSLWKAAERGRKATSRRTSWYEESMSRKVVNSTA